MTIKDQNERYSDFELKVLHECELPEYDEKLTDELMDEKEESINPDYVQEQYQNHEPGRGLIVTVSYFVVDKWNSEELVSSRDIETKLQKEKAEIKEIIPAIVVTNEVNRNDTYIGKRSFKTYGEALKAIGPDFERKLKDSFEIDSDKWQKVELQTQEIRKQ